MGLLDYRMINVREHVDIFHGLKAGASLPGKGGERLVWSGLTMMAGKPVVEQGADEENGTDGKETVQCDEAIELRNGECRHGVTFSTSITRLHGVRNNRGGLRRRSTGEMGRWRGLD